MAKGPSNSETGNFFQLLAEETTQIIIMPGFFENRVTKDTLSCKDSFYYLAIKNSQIRPKADRKPISDAGHC